MKNSKATLLILLLLAIVTFGCSAKTPIVTPKQEASPAFESVTVPLVIEPESLPEAYVEAPYEIEIHITQNKTPVGDMFIKKGSLPAGLEFAFLEGEDSAKISGIPQEAGIFTITIYAWCFGTMVSGQTLEKEYHIVVNQ